MNFIQKIQKVFNTDKWWGRLSVLLFFYSIYFIFGYWFWVLIAFCGIISSDIFVDQWFPSVYFLFVLPILSFMLINKINKKLNLKINKIFLFFINLIIVFINLFLFVFIGMYLFMKPEMFI
jgi:hypothetical protein